MKNVSIFNIQTKIKERVVNQKGIYILAVIGVTIIYLLNGKDIWAEIVAEYMRYAQGKELTSSLAGYLTLFPIVVGYIYHFFVSWTSISWFGFSAFIAWIYTVLCVIAIVRVLNKRISNLNICVILISLFAFLGHPSVSSLINITHLGYIPILLYIIVSIFDRKHIDGIANAPVITFIPLIVSMLSKPSFSGFALVLVLLLTKTYKKPLTWIVLAASSCLSIYQLLLYSHGSVSLKLAGITSLVKFALIFVQSIGESVVFAGTYYFEGQLSKSLILLSYVIGFLVLYGIGWMFWKNRNYRSAIGTVILMGIIGATVMPYLLLDYSKSLSTLMKEDGELAFGKHKLQYQLTSSVINITILLYVFSCLCKMFKFSSMLQKGVSFLCLLLALNGMFMGIYSGQWQTVNEITTEGAIYKDSDSYIYPPLPDWDWNWSDSTTGWVKGKQYAKYLKKPQNVGDEFQNKNLELPPLEVRNGRIFIMYSDPVIGVKSPTYYWETFTRPDNSYSFSIGDLKVKLSRATPNGIRYGVLDYSPELAELLYSDNYIIKQEGNEDGISAEHLNFIIVHD